MNYLESVNRFWKKSDEYHFTDRETALYFYLLNICYSGRCNNPCCLSNSTVMSFFGWGRISFERARNRLRYARLIDFRHGLGRGNTSQYLIIDVAGSNPGSGEVPVQTSLSDSIKGYGKGYQTDTFPELKGIRENVFSGRIPESSIEKGVQKDAFPGDISYKDTPEDTFFMQKEDSKDSFPGMFLEKSTGKGISENTVLSSKPLKTTDLPLQNSLNDHINNISNNNSNNNNSNNSNVCDDNENRYHQKNIENKKPYDSEPVFFDKKNKDRPASGNEEKDSVQKEKEVVELYRTFCGSFPAIIRLTCNRKGKIMQRLREMGSTGILEQVFRKMEASDFLKGNNRYGWRASFDWVFKNQDNWMKILEGNYDNRTPQFRFVQPANDPRFMGMLQTDLSKF